VGVESRTVNPSDISALRVPGRPTLSPDGQYAVVSVSHPDLTANDYTACLWLVPTDGSAPARQLTYGWRDTEPRWSPDGQHLAFVRATRDEKKRKTGRTRLGAVPALGGELRQLTGQPSGAGA